MKKQIEYAIEVLEYCKEYFDNKADADWEGDPGEYIPNEEMKMLAHVNDAIIDLKKLLPDQNDFTNTLREVLQIPKPTELETEMDRLKFYYDKP